MAPIQDPPLPKYQCHKIVEALKIREVEPMRAGAVLYPEDARFAPIEVSPSFYNSRIPIDNGTQREEYWVRYSDGFESWSPTGAFEEGYTLIKE
jgi:hypothetical protein